MANPHQQYEEVGVFKNVFSTLMAVLAAAIVTPLVIWGVGWVIFGVIL